MRCIRPIKVGFDFDGNLTYKASKKHPEMDAFAFVCRKCLPCRLNLAREKAIRCYHESRMFENNIFLTLTYDDEHLESPRLIYSHFQTFMKDLRNHVGHSPDSRIGVMVTGEYGERFKRPHWHALLFNYAPTDSKDKYTTDTGNRVFSSERLTDLWGRGIAEFGSVTLDSASYVARYSAKKLVHGNDDEHDYHPIHKTSSRNAIGKAWIEKHWKQVFDHGYVYLPNGSKAGIPRYYVDWLKKTHLDAYLRYVTQQREQTIRLANEVARREEMSFISNILNHRGSLRAYPMTRSQVKLTCLKQKFKSLQEQLKL